MEARCCAHPSIESVYSSARQQLRSPIPPCQQGAGATGAVVVVADALTSVFGSGSSGGLLFRWCWDLVMGLQVPLDHQTVGADFGAGAAIRWLISAV